MAKLNNPVEILKLLDKSNCKACGEKTCMAFAAAVFQGKLRLSDCPKIDQDTLARFEGAAAPKNIAESDFEETLARLKDALRKTDLEKVSNKIGGTYKNGWLTLKVLGKDFRVDASGNMKSNIHINPWVVPMVLTYIVRGAGRPLSGKWVSLRELEGGMAFKGLFEQRSEKPLKKVADTYTSLFEDLIYVFQGKQVENHYASDIAVVLYPLPLAPILICYWKPDDGLESTLNIFFDESIQDNLGTDAAYGMVTGLVVMFEKMALTHGFEAAKNM